MDLNDRRASELISQSLDRPLTQEEMTALSDYLANNPQGRIFERTVKYLQQAAADMSRNAEQGVFTNEERLSDSSREQIDYLLKHADQSAKQPLAVASAASNRDRDLAFASVLLESQRMSADQLSAAAESWKADSCSLSDFLLERGILSEDARDLLESRVEKEMKSTLAGVNDDTVIVGGKAPGQWSLYRPGVSDQISKLIRLSYSDSESLEVRVRFRLLRSVGEGGLGNVWLARDETLKRNIAVKRLHSEGASTETLARFRREAEITGLLEHPNIIPVYLAGSDGNTGKDLYVMRFVGKRTLADAIHEYHEIRSERDDDPVLLHRLLELFLRICDAIAYAHSRGVIHRDLKPDNVALDSFGQVIVLDWGLAKVVDDADAGVQLAFDADVNAIDPVQTSAGAVIGTPLYMSPEQAAGDLNSIDQRTDIYGLGAILFAILTGHAPHEKSCTLVDGRIDVVKLIAAIAEKESPRPRDINPEICPDLEAVCRRAMAFSRHARHEAVTRLAEEIVAWQSGTRERQNRYHDLQMQGREIATALQNCFRELVNTARFVSCLPPIQEIAQLPESGGEDGFDVWRERLTIILRGLIQANSDLSGVAYQRLSESRKGELVRVERHMTDRSKVRAIPQSRLKNELNDFASHVLELSPDDALSTISLRRLRGNRQTAYLETGTPVFDENTEEPFGNVVVDATLENVLGDRLNTTESPASEIIICDSSFHVFAQYMKSRKATAGTAGRSVAEVSPEWATRVDQIDLHEIETEWQDEGMQFYIRKVVADSIDDSDVFVLVRC